MSRSDARGSQAAGMQPVDQRFLDHVEAYCAELVDSRNASAHTVRSYRADLLDFGRWAARWGLDPVRVTFRQVRRYLGELDQAQYSRRTVNRRLSALRGLFRWMQTVGLVEADPFAVLQGPKLQKSLPRVIPAEDMAAILKVHMGSSEPVDLRDQAILEFLYACGARISEAAGLRANNVDFSSKQVKVFGKGSKERIIPLHDMACAAMERYARDARPSLLGGGSCPFFFVSVHGKGMSADVMRRMFKNTLLAAGVSADYTPHDMRHTFATDLVEGGADLRSVQEMLGHESLSTTQIYTHLSPGYLKSAHHQAHPRG